MHAVILGAICFAAAAVHILGDYKGSRPASAAGKIIASSSFVTLAVMNRATDTGYGRLILIALALSWLGDVLLLPRSPSFLMAGMATFLAAHLAFAAAFTSASIDAYQLSGAFLCFSFFGILVIHWLWKHLTRAFRPAMIAYLVVIIVMASLAIAFAAATGQVIVAIAAIAFMISDISVARDRFVERNIVNRIWGLPLYYFAQLLFAATVLAS